MIGSFLANYLSPPPVHFKPWWSQHYKPEIHYKLCKIITLSDESIDFEKESHNFISPLHDWGKQRLHRDSLNYRQLKVTRMGSNLVNYKLWCGWLSLKLHWDRPIVFTPKKSTSASYLDGVTSLKGVHFFVNIKSWKAQIKLPLAWICQYWQVHVACFLWCNTGDVTSLAPHNDVSYKKNFLPDTMVCLVGVALGSHAVAEIWHGGRGSIFDMISHIGGRQVLAPWGADISQFSLLYIYIVNWQDWFVPVTGPCVYIPEV